MYSTAMSIPTTHTFDSDILRSIIEHVFMPPKLPQVGTDAATERKMNMALCTSLIQAARDFLKTLPSSESFLWNRMIKMMELVRRAAEAQFTKDGLQHVLSNMALGGMSR
jgi:hypothetical protein